WRAVLAPLGLRSDPCLCPSPSLPAPPPSHRVTGAAAARFAASSLNPQHPALQLHGRRHICQSETARNNMDTELFMECEEEELEPWQQVDDSVEEDEMDFDDYSEPVEDSPSPLPASETPPPRTPPAITPAPTASPLHVVSSSVVLPPPPTSITPTPPLPSASLPPLHPRSQPRP
ncbi:hypothetical protein INR49_005987, partial [Caranx melampygus]